MNVFNFFYFASFSGGKPPPQNFFYAGGGTPVCRVKIQVFFKRKKILFRYKAEAIIFIMIITWTLWGQR